MIQKTRNIISTRVNFNFDLWEESNTRYKLPLVGNNRKWFDTIMSILYDGQFEQR